jgi:glutamyl/glutaminyl-tRNA synthetase
MLSKLFGFKFSIRLRYSPSTGSPFHIGFLRSALLSYLFASCNNGKFILHIDDNHSVFVPVIQQSNRVNSAEEILETFKWLGIAPHESAKAGGPFQPYLQSQRLELYKENAEGLLKRGLAYACFCGESKEEGSYYDGRCRKLPIEEVGRRFKSGERFSIRMKSDIQNLIVKSFWDDGYGEVISAPFDDFILMRSNGWPSPHFANAVDDWRMSISHVVRGV